MRVVKSARAMSRSKDREKNSPLTSLKHADNATGNVGNPLLTPGAKITGRTGNSKEASKRGRCPVPRKDEASTRRSIARSETSKSGCLAVRSILRSTCRLIGSTTLRRLVDDDSPANLRFPQRCGCDVISLLLQRLSVSTADATR